MPNSKGTSLVAQAELALQTWAERKAWLKSMHISSHSIRTYGLDRPMPDLGWIVLARDVIRYSATMRKGHIMRKTKRKVDTSANHGASPQQTPVRSRSPQDDRQPVGTISGR